MADRETGTVTKWNEKGYGFIERDSMSDSIFVHRHDTLDRQALIPGSRVSFIYEIDQKCGKGKEVAVEEIAEAAPLTDEARETGKVKGWNADKGFGFIGRANGEADAFFHKKDFGGYGEPYVGQAVSFVLEERPKGPAATNVKEEKGGIPLEETFVEDEGGREMGTVKRWNAAKGFGFIGRVGGKENVFFHKKSFDGSDDPYVGQTVSFVFEETLKGQAAVKVKEEEGISVEEEEHEEEREMGKVKTYNEDKGFTFISRCLDATEIFGHKREFPQDVVPYVGQTVSFVFEITEKGGTARKIREEDSFPDIPFSYEGRDFGTIKASLFLNFNSQKGFGFIVERKTREEVRFFEKSLNEVVPEKNRCVSFVREEGYKGPLAKDLREENPDRVERVTAKTLYGKVVIYKASSPTEPGSGFGFIVELDQLFLEKPKKHYFHMSEIKTPNERGGIELDTMVSFIVIDARRGSQAAAVTITCPPKAKETKPEEEAPLETAMERMHVTEATETTTDAWSDDWGSGRW